MSGELIAAVVTPLCDGGEALDEEAIGPLVEFVEAGGHCDGVFVAGTTGEGILLRAEERRRATEVFCAVSKGRRIIHTGAQTTAETVALSAHAAESGADGVAVISPPYFPLDDRAAAEHLIAAGRACAPLPFYIYVFSARTGYPLSVAAVEAVAERVDNLVGLKVTEPSFEAVSPFLGLGLEVLVGSEATIPAAMDAGAKGAVSALAGIYPEKVRAVIDEPARQGAADEMSTLYRDLAVDGGLIAGIKAELGRRGLPVRTDMRRPLRGASIAHGASSLEASAG
ncbi:MAG TPA: dihydrodipicolinate synthase family protein [Solirubrobacterales bacterium]